MIHKEETKVALANAVRAAAVKFPAANADYLLTLAVSTFEAAVDKAAADTGPPAADCLRHRLDVALTGFEGQFPSSGRADSFAAFQAILAPAIDAVVQAAK